MTTLIHPKSLPSWAATSIDADSTSAATNTATVAAPDDDDLDPLAAMTRKELRFPVSHGINSKIILWFVASRNHAFVASSLLTILGGLDTVAPSSFAYLLTVCQ